MVDQTRTASRIPAFASIEEAAAFWATHDTGDFEDEFEPVALEIDPDAGHILSIRVDRVTFRRLNAIAKRRGDNMVSLAKTWVLEAIDREEADVVETAGPAPDR